MAIVVYHVISPVSFSAGNSYFGASSHQVGPLPDALQRHPMKRAVAHS